MPRGNWRRVLLIGPFAVKIPRKGRRQGAMCLNRWEHEMWTVWRPKFNWKHLCPVLWCAPTGAMLVMQRGTSDATEAEIRAIYGRFYPDVGCEDKCADWGHVDGRLVVFDYGYICDSEAAMQQQREYYGGKTGPAVDTSVDL